MLNSFSILNVQHTFSKVLNNSRLDATVWNTGSATASAESIGRIREIKSNTKRISSSDATNETNIYVSISKSQLLNLSIGSDDFKIRIDCVFIVLHPVEQIILNAEVIMLDSAKAWYKVFFVVGVYAIIEEKSLEYGYMPL
jgi:hypothetical protein